MGRIIKFPTDRARKPSAAVDSFNEICRRIMAEPEETCGKELVRICMAWDKGLIDGAEANRRIVKLYRCDNDRA